MCMYYMYLYVFLHSSSSLIITIDHHVNYNALPERQYQLAVPNFWPGRFVSVHVSTCIHVCTQTCS